MRAGEDLTARRTYGQVCPIAKTLDVVGDRWTLLIIRDMLLGAAKFKDFLERQPAMPARILSDRLKKLEASGIIVGWDRDEWEIWTTTIGLNIRIAPKKAGDGG